MDENIKDIDFSVAVLPNREMEKEIRIPSEAEKEAGEYLRLTGYMRSGELLMGKVVGVSREMDRAMIHVAFEGYCDIIIPDELYFEPDFSFSIGYERLDPENKLIKRLNSAKYQIGAHIYFVVESIKKERIEEGSLAGTYRTVCTGNRRKAMEIVRDRFFFHKLRTIETAAPIEVKEGMTARAHIIAVKEYNALAEVCGVETRIGVTDITEGDVVTNCTDAVKPGDEIKVMVKKLYINDDGSIHLSVTRNFGKNEKSMAGIVPGGVYLGTVDRYNKYNDSYTVRLFNGVSVSVLQRYVRGGIRLYRGDRLMVCINSIHGNFATGYGEKV